MKILLVRLSSMGDLIHTLPALTDLARHRPDVQLDWLCEAAFADIARLHPFTAKVLPMRWRQWRKQLLKKESFKEAFTALDELCGTLRAARYDWVLDSQGLLKSAAFARLAGAPVYGLDKNSAREPLATWAYHRRFAVETGRDAVWRNRTLFAQAFAYSFEGEADFGVSGDTGFRLPEMVQPYGVVLHAASRADKHWQADAWRELMQRWHQEQGLPLWLPWGSDAERERAEQLAQGLDFVRVCPSLSLAQAADVLRGATAVVGVDTGLLHLADAVGVPVVGIYTASHPHKTGLQPSARACAVGAMGQIPTVDEVYQALQQVMP